VVPRVTEMGCNAIVDIMYVFLLEWRRCFDTGHAALTCGIDTTCRVHDNLRLIRLLSDKYIESYHQDISLASLSTSSSASSFQLNDCMHFGGSKPADSTLF
jgi:hypothetical protein